MLDKPRFLPAGDQAFLVELGSAVSPEANRRVRNLMLAIEKRGLPGVTDLVPAYCSLLVYYDPLKVSFQELQAAIAEADQHLDQAALEKPRVVHIPVLYGGEHGPDLDFVAKHTGLSPEEVVRLHSGTNYLVYMMGFSPGFPYLGGLSEKLVTPRLTTPRVKIPAGSVGIAEKQTGIYPVDSPGGWRIIGRTPLRLFDPHREPPTLMNAGDYIRFVPLDSEQEYLDIQRQVESGTYQVTTEAAP